MDEIKTEAVNPGSNEPTTVLIADDHPLVRQAIRSQLENHNDIKLVGEAGDGEQAVAMVLELQPNIVIMDISMPKLNGIEATRAIKAKLPAVKVLALTVHSDTEHVLGILEAGAAGYLTKSVFGEEVIIAIRALMSGESVVSSPLLHQILKNAYQTSAKPLESNKGENLNPRELEILRLLARGMSNRDIASHLNLSLQTIKGYSVTIFSKLQVGSRTEAVIKGLRSRIIALEDLEQ
jgi:two-component system, NarL family, response regulator LiaR